ncbi:MAG TPA: hypothetical protein VGH34_05765 [Vicinamibacterales bacterium]
MGFLKDDTVFVTFPYFRHRTGLLSSATIPAKRASQSTDTLVSLEEGGRVTSHLVKYSHHPNGLALFSQTGKIRSEVRRQSVALDRQEGHLFTVLINGLEAFKRAEGPKDEGQITPDRAVVDFQLPADSDPGGTLKLVGRWGDVSRLRFAEQVDTIGPVIPVGDPSGRRSMAAILANPADEARHVLILTGDVMPPVGTDPEMLMFIGGFDHREEMNDPTREAGFLAFQYPVTDAADLRRKVGSIDFT